MPCHTGTCDSSASDREDNVIQPSRRANWDLSPNAFTSAYQRRLADGLPLFDLVQSNPTTVGFDFDPRAVLRALADPACLRYEPSPLGIPIAREAVAAWYQQRGLRVDASQLILTASSSEAYTYLLTLLCDPGDSILVPAPSYPLFDQLARLQNVSIRRYPLVAVDQWRIDEQGLRDAIGPTCRAVFVVSPNNPTGSYLHEDERRVIEEVAREHGLAVICDEVFAEYVWSDSPDRVRCAALGASVPTFSLGGLSKSAGMPQMKVGWIVVGGEPTGEAIVRLEMIADTYLSVSAPVQHALGAMLEASDAVRRQIAARVGGNLAALGRILGHGSPVTVGPVHAGWYVCLRVPSVMSDESWCELLVERDGVVVHPGAFFGFDRPGTVVVGLIAPADVFVEGVERLNRRVRTVAGPEL